MSAIMKLATGSTVTTGSDFSSPRSHSGSILADSLDDFYTEGMICLAAIDGRFHLTKQFDNDYDWTNDEVGRGICGVVRVAERIGGSCFDSEMGTMRCVKTCRKRARFFGQDPEEALDDLKRECSIYLSVDHPNIARLIDIYEDPAQILMVMEYCRGGTLEARIQSRGSIPEKQSQKWLFNIFLAARYLHNIGIAHRDIKPLNIVFCDESDDSMLKLIDFDASATCPDLDTGDMLRGIVGTPAYCPPEMFASSRDNGQWYDTKADMWSTGVTLFKMLCGKEPFSAPACCARAPADSDAADAYMEEEWVTKIINGDYGFDAAAWQTISPTAKDMVQQLLTVDPQKRPSAAEAMRHAWVEGRQEERAKISLWGEELAHSMVNAFVAFLGVSEELRYILQTLCYSKVDFEMQRILPIFGLFDRKGMGEVDLEDFTAAFNDLQSELTVAQCAHLFGRLTACFEEKSPGRKSQPSVLKYSEFMAAVLPIITQPAFMPTVTDGHGIGLSVLDIEHDLRTTFNLGPRAELKAVPEDDVQMMGA